MINIIWRSFAFSLLLFFSTVAIAGEAPSIRLSPEDQDHWRAEYKLKKPASALTFSRDIVGARKNTWRPADDGFEIVYDDETETLRRKDGAPFASVSVIAPTTYVTPEKGYLTFARFSDGGLLAYTGNFHACAGDCPKTADGDEGPWRVTINPGRKTRMIVQGAVKHGKASFEDAGDGTKIYVGNGEIIEGPSLLAVVDPGLPSAIKEKLDSLFPSLMGYFGKKLWPLDEKQMLFVSWDVPGVVKGAESKGGTLSGQVFIHFEGAKIPEYAAKKDYPYSLAWFFAHEAGHLHQRHRNAQYDESESWIHEGGADALAYTALKDLGAAPEDYLAGWLVHAKDACAKALEEGPLNGAAKRGAFQAYYDCGVLMHLAAARSAQHNSGVDLFGVWREYISRIENGAPWTTATFVSVVSDLGDPETAAFTETLATKKIDDPSAFLEQGLAATVPEAISGKASE